MNTRLRLCVAAASLALLGACGGGSDPAPVVAEPTPLTTEPDSATASINAYASFTSQVIADAKGSETAAPFMLSAASAPTSETAYPVAVAD